MNKAVEDIVRDLIVGHLRAHAEYSGTVDYLYDELGWDDEAVDYLASEIHDEFNAKLKELADNYEKENN